MRRPLRSRRLPALVVLLGVGALVAGCGGGDDDAAGPAGSVGPGATAASGPVNGAPTTAPAAATGRPGPPGTLADAPGDEPSELSRMVCEEQQVWEAVEYYTSEELVAPPVPTWEDRLYTCPYVVADGTLTISVKELDDVAATDDYFGELRTALGDVGRIYLGDDAFQTSAGSVVVRKDNLVMLVDSTTLPDHPSPRTRSQVATNVATIIMACWVGE